MWIDDEQYEKAEPRTEQVTDAPVEPVEEVKTENV